MQANFICRAVTLINPTGSNQLTDYYCHVSLYEHREIKVISAQALNARQSHIFDSEVTHLSVPTTFIIYPVTSFCMTRKAPQIRMSRQVVPDVVNLIVSVSMVSSICVHSADSLAWLILEPAFGKVSVDREAFV